MYDDKLDGLIDEGLFRQKLEDYKKRQGELRDQLARHETADLQFHVTANLVMQLAKRAWEIFESSEVEEKRQLLNFVFQNLKLDGKNLLVSTCEPFHLFIQVKDSPGRMGVVGLEPTETEVEGFTVGFPSTHQRKLEYIGATQSKV